MESPFANPKNCGSRQILVKWLPALQLVVRGRQRVALESTLRNYIDAMGMR